MNEAGAVRRMVRKVERQAPGEVRFCYEAGPCGYSLQRQITEAGEASSPHGRLPHHGPLHLEAHDLKPHRLETFKVITDPNAEERIHDVVGLYLNPPTNAVVLSFDEKTQIQALERTQPLLPVCPGLSARQTHDYRRAGVTSLYAALEVASGKVIGQCRPRANGSEFLDLLKTLAVRFRKRELHVVLDNSSTHTTPAVRQWLDEHPRVHLHFTPKGASWLNLIEAWFGILTRKSIRRGSFQTVTSLSRHIGRYIDHWNENPTPFVWTKQPADIIRKALRRTHSVTENGYRVG